MILIVGLGNPGGDYTGTRHNIGFAIIDELVSSLDSGSKYTKFNSIAVRAGHGGHSLLLLKPQTFMNNSGSAVRSALDFLGGELESMLVVHDDIDLEFGCIRIKSGGSTAGHRGLESIFQNTGNLSFDRLRFGVGRPPGKMEASDYVLRLFNRGEKEELGPLTGLAVDMIKDYVEKGPQYTANKYN